MEERKRKLKKLLKNLMEKLSQSYVIVEGKKDVKAMREIGIESNPYTKKSIERAKGKVIVLTDLDKEGERLAKEIEGKLKENTNVEEIDINTRKRLSSLLNLRHFEEIKKKLEKFIEKIEGG